MTATPKKTTTTGNTEGTTSALPGAQTTPGPTKTPVDAAKPNFNKEVSAAYDVLYADLLGFKGVAKRSAFVIDENGEIIYSESSDDPKQLPNFEAIKAALA